MRWAALVLCCVVVVACKKKDKEPEPAAMPTTPSTGHSSTKIADQPEPEPGSAHGGGSAVAQAPGSAGEPAERPTHGGTGQPAYRDEGGHVKGPGGPLFMGHGDECTDKIDHCLREGVWFAVGNVQRGHIYRATPVFQFEDKWWSWRGDPETDWQTLYRTKVAESSSDVRAGSPVIWLIEENSSSKWLVSEFDALTTSRWEAGIVESVGGSTIKVDGWDHAIPLDTVRVIVQQKKS